jgi:hypothetical protein
VAFGDAPTTMICSVDDVRMDRLALMAK